MRSISTKKKKIIRRSVSLVVALGMLMSLKRMLCLEQITKPKTITPKL